MVTVITIKPEAKGTVLASILLFYSLQKNKYIPELNLHDLMWPGITCCLKAPPLGVSRTSQTGARVILLLLILGDCNA
jgi:hypothetical protein